MKQKNHLNNLRELLQTIQLIGVPALIIDDEADQHSMNTHERRNTRTGRADMSTIHRRIVSLREIIPHHTFIQYTATPQAPLFINIMNNLSPNFIQLLTPGPGYTGGQTFFLERPELSSIIDDIEPDEDLSVPPQSLVYAMKIFFLGVVKGKPTREGKNRSMMIHPSQYTYTHADYFTFVSNIKNSFVDTLLLPDTDPDKIDLINEFKEAYLDLQTTADDIPPFADLCGHRLRHAINSTVIQSLNSKDGNRTIVEWRNSYSWILIGGQAMDRGFTVEGLTVTYMPRSVGMGNADTIQQRARFMGYKNSYIGYCRVYLDEIARSAYIDYVRHEEDMRRRLSQHNQSRQPLNDWFREVFLTSDLNLARPNVFANTFDRSIFGGQWSAIKIPHYSQYIITENQTTTRNFIQNTDFNNSSRFSYAELPLAIFYDTYLNELRYTSPQDSANFTAMLYTLSKFIEENPDEICTVYLMSSFEEPRERNLIDNQINQLFQGPSANYGGDRTVKGTGITFQIHILDLLLNDQKVFSQISTIATYIPEEIGTDIIRWAIN